MIHPLSRKIKKCGPVLVGRVGLSPRCSTILQILWIRLPTNDLENVRMLAGFFPGSFDPHAFGSERPFQLLIASSLINHDIISISFSTSRA
jgi:hypothetical protein